MSDPHLPPKTGPIVRYVAGGDVEIECPRCGVTNPVVADPVGPLMRDIEAFVDTHLPCWCPVMFSE